MKHMFNNLVFFASNSETFKSNLKEVMDGVQWYINVVLGASTGLIVLVSLVIGSIAWFKASKADNDQERAGELRKIKWLVGFFLFVIIAWGISGGVIKILQATWGVL
ncbi:Mbov_0395 family pilin-like conjugal transfer protein [Mycoplasma putrefaciens]|uniref:Mbov_0395 family pilin-like conjugal transfer protein n=1 Tax=Mycoplasma putrefaciens TaxID=2123 RepID=UPI00039B7E12|nr:hypothetical protein [Mycoplasma putrefaciens]